MNPSSYGKNVLARKKFFPKIDRDLLTNITLDYQNIHRYVT